MKNFVSNRCDITSFLLIATIYRNVFIVWSRWLENHRVFGIWELGNLKICKFGNAEVQKKWKVWKREISENWKHIPIKNLRNLKIKKFKYLKKLWELENPNVWILSKFKTLRLLFTRHQNIKSRLSLSYDRQVVIVSWTSLFWKSRSGGRKRKIHFR